MSDRDHSHRRRPVQGCSPCPRQYGTALMLAAFLCAVMPVTNASAQVDDGSHRLLNNRGRGLADLQAQAELLSRLRMLTESGLNPTTYDPEANPGIADPQVQQALQEMLTDQLIDSLTPPAQPGPDGNQPFDPESFGGLDPSDPNVQAMLERLSQQTGLPLDDMVRQRVESGQPGTEPLPGRPGSQPGIPQPRPGTTPGVPAIPPGLLERILSGQQGTIPGSQPGARQPGTNLPGEDIARRQQHLQELTEVLKRIGMNGGVNSSNPNASNPNARPGRTPTTGPNSRPNAIPGSTPSDRMNDAQRNRNQQQPSDRERQERDGTDTEADTGESDGDIWQKLGQIVQQARDRSNSGDDTTDGAGSGARSALARAIEDTTRDLAGRAEDFFENRSRSQQQQRPSESGFFQSIGRATDSANNLVLDLTNGRDSNASRSASFSSSDSSEGSFPLMTLVVISLILTTCVSLYRHRESFNRQQSESSLPVIPKHLRDRADVVRAFHALTARCPEALHNWWTHRRAAVVLTRVNPEQTEAIETLAGLYEQARYLPENEDFTEQQLESARRALRRFGVS